MKVFKKTKRNRNGKDVNKLNNKFYNKTVVNSVLVNSFYTH